MRIVRIIFYRLSYFFGLRARRLKAPEQVYNKLKRQPLSVKEYELKNITYFIRKTKNHKYYESLLKRYVPEWDERIRYAKFIGKGRGRNSLDSYRMIRIGDKLYFEKVYFNSFHSVQAIEWFQHHIYDRIKKKIKTPRIEKIYKGEVLTIIYFEFLELDPLPEADKEARLVKLSRDLYSLSLNKQIVSPGLDIPKSIEDVTNHVKYRRNRDTAKINLLEQGIASDKLEKYVMASKRVVTHGDIQPGNVFADSIIIDWDYFGIFPIGADPAFLYFCLPHKYKQNANFEDWLARHYNSTVKGEDWKDFEINFAYILYVISFELEENEQRKDLQKQLIKALKQKIDSAHVVNSHPDG